jgi:hypothetical protein
MMECQAGFFRGAIRSICTHRLRTQQALVLRVLRTIAFTFTVDINGLERTDAVYATTGASNRHAPHEDHGEVIVLEERRPILLYHKIL